LEIELILLKIFIKNSKGQGKYRILDVAHRWSAFKKSGQVEIKTHNSLDLPDVNIFKDQIKMLQEMLLKDIERFSRIWENHVISLKDSYEMNP